MYCSSTSVAESTKGIQFHQFEQKRTPFVNFTTKAELRCIMAHRYAGSKENGCPDSKEERNQIIRDKQKSHENGLIRSAESDTFPYNERL